MKINWRRVIILTVALGILTSLPQIISLFETGRYGVYLSRITSTPADTGAYYSNIEQVRQGRWLLENQLTSETQHPSLFHPLWLGLGWLASLTNWSTPAVFQVGRLVALFLFVVVMDLFVNQIFSERGRQWLVLLSVYTSAGLGWTMISHLFEGPDIFHAPIDLWIAESNTFRSLSHSALFIISQLCLLVFYWLAFKYLRGWRHRRLWLLGSLLTFLGIIHPYDLISAGIIMLGLFCLVVIKEHKSTTEIKQLALTMISWWAWVVPVLVYYYGWVYQQPAMRGWFEQNVNINATPLANLLGFGLLLPLAIIGGVVEWRKKNEWSWLLIIWAGLTMIISYTPGLSLQRRLLNGVHIPLALLAGAGLWWLIKKYGYRRWQALLMGLLVFLLAMTNFKHVQGDVQEVMNPSRAFYPMYISEATNQGVKWLKQNSQINEIVLADFWPGNIIAGLAGRPQVMAHGNQTIKPLERIDDWTKFQSAQMTDQERTAILQRLRVTWLWWTPENDQSGGYRPAKDTRWEKKFQNKAVTIYRLK